METVRIVVCDNIGNVLLGVRPWERWPERTRARLLAQGMGRAETPSLGEIFAGYKVALTWLWDAEKAARGFRDLFAEHAAELRDATDPGEVARAVAGADLLVVHKETVPPEALRGATRLRLITHLGQDYRGVPIEVARAMGVPVAAVPLTNYLAVAEHAWALILGHLKRLRAQRALMAGGGYAESWGYVPGQRLARGLTLGLLGLGEIARPLARYARAFAMDAIYWDRARFPNLEEREGVRYVAWDDLFHRADILSVHLPITEETRGIVGAREIGLLRPTALFVNTARGGLVDQGALTAALRDRRLGGAALDVFAEEPLPPDDPLRALHADPAYDVTLTPHASALAPASWVRDSREVWENARRALRGEPLRYLV